MVTGRDGRVFVGWGQSDDGGQRRSEESPHYRGILVVRVVYEYVGIVRCAVGRCVRALHKRNNRDI
jgi:hypothetical protein